MKIKIIEYNINHGFYKTNFNSKGSFDFEPKRLVLAQAIINIQNQDVLVLLEAAFCKKNRYNILMEYHKLFNFTYHYEDLTNYEWGFVVLSKYPILNGQNLSKDKMIFARLKIDLGKEKINLDITHPHPSLSEYEKLQFFDNILNNFDKPYILTGDFNSISDEDSYNHDKLLKGFSLFDKNAKATVDKFMERAVIPKIRDYQLIDTFKIINKNFGYTIPTDILSKNKNTGLRLDYLFCSKEFKILDSGIIRNELTENASDHYPIYAILEI